MNSRAQIRSGDGKYSDATRSRTTPPSPGRRSRSRCLAGAIAGLIWVVVPGVTALRKNGYRVLEAASGKDALEVFRDHSSEIDLLFTDVMMPGNLLGDELATRLRVTKPSLAVLYTSGYTPEVAQPEFRGNGNFLIKPFTPAQMLSTVRRCLDHAVVENGKTKN